MDRQLTRKELDKHGKKFHMYFDSGDECYCGEVVFYDYVTPEGWVFRSHKDALMFRGAKIKDGKWSPVYTREEFENGK